MSRRPLSLGEKFLFIGCGFLCLATLGISQFYSYQNELPPLTITSVEVPNPNAFDAIMSAINIAPLPPSKITNRDNCTSLNVDREFTCDGPFAFNQPKPYSADYNRDFPVSRKRIYLSLAQPALIQWRQALRTPFYEPQEKDEVTWYMRWKLEEAARTQARADWQNHRTGEALEWLLIWHHHVCRETTSFYNGKIHSTGIFTLEQSIKKRGLVLDEIELLAPHLNSKQMRHTALGLQSNRALLPSRLEALLASKNQILERVHRACIGNDLRLAYNEKYPEAMKMEYSKLLRFRWANKKAGLERIEKRCQWVLDQERQGWPSLDISASPYMDSNDPLGQFGIYTNASSNKQNAVIETREVVFISAIAARAFALEKGAESTKFERASTTLFDQN